MTWRSVNRRRRPRPPAVAANGDGSKPRRRAVQHEKIEQQHGEAILAPLAFKVYRFGTRRATRCSSCGAISTDLGTRQTPGPADVLAFMKPPRYKFIPTASMNSVLRSDYDLAPIGPRGIWWEAKSPTAMKAKDHGQSDEQREFEAECTRAGWTYVLGDLNALVAFLIAGGWLRRQDVAWYRLPPTPSCTCGSSAAAPCAVHGGVTIPKPSTTAGD